MYLREVFAKTVKCNDMLNFGISQLHCRRRELIGTTEKMWMWEI